jgi:6-phosphogluconolactonase (cycloisomerase 2 family)
MRTIVHSALGRTLHTFTLDPAEGRLEPIQSLDMPAIVQVAWASRDRSRLYVASSDAGPMVKEKRPHHFVQAFRILASGSLEPHGDAVRLGNRPLYVSLDATEEHLLLAYNDPSDVTVHRLDAEGRIGAQVRQPPMDFGDTVHQVRVTPAGTHLIVPACAHHPTGDIPGSVGVYSYEVGRLTPHSRIEGDPSRAAAWAGQRWGAHGFAARHVDFHPTRPWMFLCVERQGELHLYDYDAGGVSLKPRAVASTLEGAAPGRAMQLASAIQVHPHGHCVYVTNRARETETIDGRPVFKGGVNDIAVFTIDQQSGVPRLVQRIDSQGIFPRTFGIDDTGRFMVVGNQEPLDVRAGDGFARVLPNLAVFRIGADGHLTFLHRRDFPDNGQVCFWTGVIALP